MFTPSLYLLFSVLVITLSFMLPGESLAQDFTNDEGISKEKLSESILKNTNLQPEQVDELIRTLQKQFNVKPDQVIPIKGYLYASGMNGAFFVDHDTWYFDATLKIPGYDELVNIRELFLCDFHNGGLKIEIAYKWMFTFIPKGVNVDQLHGGVYGRGIGLVAETFLGLEGSWMPAQNRPHDILHVALKAGFGGGFVFPKMEFKMRKILDKANTTTVKL